MSDIHSYPKIFAVGSDFIPNLFQGDVEVTEKIDGSLFGFGMTEGGQLVMRSKGKQIFPEDVPKMFVGAVDYALSLRPVMEVLPKPVFFYGEFLGSPDHNILKYGRVPKHGIALFGVSAQNSWANYEELRKWAEKLDLEPVALLHQGKIGSYDDLTRFLDCDSMLGSEKVEGVVVKNYAQPCIIGNLVFPSMGKYVAEQFKERHATEWGPKFSGTSKLQAFLDSFRTEARWEKAVQHLRDDGLLTNEPKDIGSLLKELERDLLDEEAENIKKGLFALYKDEIVRKARAGLPEWYKERLTKRAFKTEPK